MALGFLAAARGSADEVVFRDDFRDRLAPGWSWVREEPAAWRIRDGALEFRLLPGNLWGPANDARNVLVRSAPDPAGGELEISLHSYNGVPGTEHWARLSEFRVVRRPRQP